MIIFFGAAGSGKTTQGRILSEKFGWKWLSVGQVLRDTGDFADTLKSGELVDDETVIRLMNAQIEKAEAEGMDVILDGYPRDVAQAEWMVNNIADKIDGAIILDVPKEELIKRIEGRGRADDTKEAVERRFAIFEQNICSILPLLKSKNVKITTVDGVGTFEEVTERLVSAVRELVPDATEQETDVNNGVWENSYGE